MKIYGISTCGSVKNSMKFLREKGVEFEFVDFKKSPPSAQDIERWSESVGVDRLFNTKGTKYKTLNLKELNLDKESKKEWMVKEPLLIKRPVIEDERGVVVGFDVAEYESRFCSP